MKEDENSISIIYDFYNRLNVVGMVVKGEMKKKKEKGKRHKKKIEFMEVW
jgi:hypothetical protein